MIELNFQRRILYLDDQRLDHLFNQQVPVLLIDRLNQTDYLACSSKFDSLFQKLKKFQIISTSASHFQQKHSTNDLYQFH